MAAAASFRKRQVTSARRSRLITAAGGSGVAVVGAAGVSIVAVVTLGRPAANISTSRELIGVTLRRSAGAMVASTTFVPGTVVDGLLRLRPS